MRAAIYTRFSSDRQTEASTERQLASCDRRAEHERWECVARFADEAISGSTANRPGYQAMLRAAEGGEFDVLLLDELSRLSRDQVESERTIRRLEFLGIRIIAVGDGYDSQQRGKKVLRAIKSLQNEMDLDVLRERVHGGLEIRARGKLNAGGRSYGYRPVKKLDPIKRDAYGEPLVLGYTKEIDHEQAEIVLEVFQRYAAGDGLRTIAADLNRREIPSPGSNWNRMSRRKDGRWLMSTIQSMLRNELYAGRYVWNRTRWERDPDTRRRRCVDRPKSDWIVHEMPELRIVPREVWDQVVARTVARAEVFPPAQTRSRTARGGQPRYVLSGLLDCGVCGSKYIINGSSPQRYCCGSHRNGGHHACANRLTVARPLVEEKLLEPVIDQLLSPETVAIASQEMPRLWRQLYETEQQLPAKSAAQVVKLDRQMEELERLMKAGVLSPAVAGAALQAARSDRDAALNASARANDRDIERVVRLLPKAAEQYRAVISKIREVVADPRDVQRARSALKDLFGGAVKLSPASSGDHLIATVSLSHTALLQAAGGRVWNGSGGRI